MKFKKILGLAALAAAGGACSSAYAGLASMQITVHHNTGDAYVDGLPATKQVNLAGDVVTTVFTCTGQVRKQIIGTGASAIIRTATFDAVGNSLSRRDATGAGTDFTYDALGRKLTETDAAIVGRVRSFAYDFANRLITATDPLGIVTTFAYDLRDRKISDSTPMNGTETRLIQYGYDGRGHMTTLTDANGAVTTWGYDKAGRQVSKTYANGDHRTMEYDALARNVKLVDENGHDILSTYDLAGRLTSKAFAADSTTDNYVYDAASRMTSVTKGRYAHTLTYTYDSVGRLATETHPDGTVITQAYDSANRLANLSLGGTGCPAVYSVDYGYDARGLLSSVTSGDYASAYDYRANGQLLSTVHSQLATPVGDILRTDRSYDSGARLLGVANTAANADQAGVVYTLGLDDQRLTATEETGQRWDYGYDNLKQLVTAKKTDVQVVVVSPLDQSYTYDPMGNRAAYTDTSGSTAYTANKANQYTTVGGITSVYDANGNLLSDGVKNYAWDAENQLISVTPVTPSEGSHKVEYTYDWRMRRTGKKSYTYTTGAWVLAKITGFKYHEWNPIEETIADGVSSAVTIKFYIWGNDLSGNLHGAGGVGGLLSMSVVSPANPQLSSDRYFYAYDGNGNVRALVKADATNPAASGMVERYFYDSFGRELIGTKDPSASVNDFRFSTKQLDFESGLNYYGFRYYSSKAGRWPNRDAILEKGGLNVYSFVHNSPIANIDVLGNDVSDLFHFSDVFEGFAQDYVSEFARRSLSMSETDSYEEFLGSVSSIATSSVLSVLRARTKFDKVAKSCITEPFKSPNMYIAGPAAAAVLTANHFSKWPFRDEMNIPIKTRLLSEDVEICCLKGVLTLDFKAVLIRVDNYQFRIDSVGVDVELRFNF